MIDVSIGDRWRGNDVTRAALPADDLRFGAIRRIESNVLPL